MWKQPSSARYWLAELSSGQRHVYLPRRSDAPLSSSIELAYQTSSEKPYFLPTIHANWVILSSITSNAPRVSAKFDPSSPITSSANKNVRETWLPLMSCPDDVYNRQDNTIVSYRLRTHQVSSLVAITRSTQASAV